MRAACWIFGVCYALGDWALMRFVAGRAAAPPERSGPRLAGGLAARDQLTFGVLAAARRITRALVVLAALLASRKENETEPRRPRGPL